MSEHSDNRCPECDATGGNHYPGCTYEGMQSNYRYSSGSRKGISTFGAIISVIAGLFLQAALYTALGIDAKDVSILVVIILWIVFSTVVAIFLDIVGL